MCGIAGAFNTLGQPVPDLVVRKMSAAMAHRGPDDSGWYCDGPIGLAHQRLAIIDLSPAGHQPMSNETGDVIVTYNGEIYNFQKLRLELEALGHRFHSQSDTEVIVHAYEEWGDACVERFNGMFAFGLYDTRQQRLLLARDRYGIKPLYWHFGKGWLLFASEIKAILEHPAVSRAVCYPALNEYFTFQNTLSDLTLFEGVRLLPAGCVLSLSLNNPHPQIKRYWDYDFSHTLSIGPQEAAEEVHRLFVQAVTRQLMSDVPVGSYLSGGMDSGSITAVASQNLQRLTTFTCGFDLSSASGLEIGFDERAKAEVLANQFKTEHYQVVLHAGDMEWVLPKLIWHLEDLRVGQSYPNYYVARLASRFVKVVLGGAGGDELFGGYPWRYYHAMDSQGFGDYLQSYYNFWQRLVPDPDKPHLFNPDTQKAIGSHSAFEVFAGVFAGWQGTRVGPQDYLNLSLYFELKTFLHGLLVVEDKLSMAHSLETRVPFLDNDLVDFALKLPPNLKLRTLSNSIDENIPYKRRLANQQTADGKTVLRQAMEKVISPEVTQRAKQGFSAPDASWFRGESIDYVNRLLRSPRARIYDYLAPSYVQRLLDEHSSGQKNHRLAIWSFLSLEWWLRAYFA